MQTKKQFLEEAKKIIPKELLHEFDDIDWDSKWVTYELAGRIDYLYADVKSINEEQYQRLMQIVYTLNDDEEFSTIINLARKLVD